MATLYVIPNWEKDFENPRTRGIAAANYFLISNTFDGRRMRRLQRLENALPFYGAFHVILAIASKTQYRGVLIDDRGPMGAIDLAEKSGFLDDVELFKEALEKLADPTIHLLEKHEIYEDENGKWALPPEVDSWAMSAEDRRRLRTAAAGNKLPPAATGGSGKTPTAPKTETPAKSPKGEPPVATGSHPSPPVSCTRPDHTIRTEVPPAVPQGGQLAESLDFGAAKQFFHELFGRSRAWSYEEDQLLHDLGGIRRQDAELLRVWFSLPADHPVFEKTKRKHNLLTLLREFNAELDKARAHENLFRHKKNGAVKKEPERWRDFFKWQYGPEIHLPAAFDALDQDQKDEYERGFQTFVEAMAQLQEERS